MSRPMAWISLASLASGAHCRKGSPPLKGTPVSSGFWRILCRSASSVSSWPPSRGCVSRFWQFGQRRIVNYIDYVQSQTKEKVNSLKLSATKDGQIDIRYELQPQKFERIRRITGYLVGTIDRWNDAKRAEEHDRVKHGLH